MVYSLPDPSSLSSLDKESKVELLNNLFEKHSEIHDLLIPKLFNRNYESYNEFIETSRKIFLALNPNNSVTQGIIAAHPRLGVPAKLSSHSNSEQKSIYNNTDADKVINQFIKLNDEYEEKFPGLRYVLFVNGRSREEIFQDFERRFKRNDYNLEVEEALNAMCDIALSRVQKLKSLL